MRLSWIPLTRRPMIRATDPVFARLWMRNDFAIR
jgi:hypothetical protein